MRLLPTAATIPLTAATLGTTLSLAQAQSCQQLWVGRNQYDKDAGYCFKTARAIRFFGNGSCSYDNERDLPLSSSARSRIAQITRLEGRMGCGN
jgi:hypothetical protein